jgi:hypothetical protein
LAACVLIAIYTVLSTGRQLYTDYQTFREMAAWFDRLKAQQAQLLRQQQQQQAAKPTPPPIPGGQ